VLEGSDQIGGPLQTSLGEIPLGEFVSSDLVEDRLDQTLIFRRRSRSESKCRLP
jgi:hypothetical protein